ncbi:MAG: hypothetical protein ACI87H_001661 [Gammaproteobacteria bacterium]|jgi:hypothetical protein
MSGPMLASDHPKLIYFAERSVEMDTAEFKARWREHARLGMSLPRWTNIRRYAHCDAIDLPASRLPIAWCDGVGVIWYRDEPRRLRHISDKSAAPMMKQDEREAFARPVREVALLADEFVIQAVADSPYKMFLRIWRQPDIAPADFRSWWLSEAGHELWQRLATLTTIQGFTQNHARLVDTEHAPPALCDCVIEIACADIAACEAVLSEALVELYGYDKYISNCSAIWTIETVLHDVP